MSSEDSGKENHSEDQLTNHTAGAAEREVSNFSDVDKLLPSEREATVGEEPAAQNGRDLPSDRGEIVSLKENDVKEQSPVDKTDLESRNGNTSGELFTKGNSIRVWHATIRFWKGHFVGPCSLLDYC